MTLAQGSDLNLVPANALSSMPRFRACVPRVAPTGRISEISPGSRTVLWGGSSYLGLERGRRAPEAMFRALYYVVGVMYLDGGPRTADRP